MPYKDRDKQLAAQRRYFQQNKELSASLKRDRRNRKLRFIQEHKSVPCADCGISYPHYVMQFDHLPGYDKNFNLSGNLAGDKTMEDIVNEIAKCEVVCANCHAHRTYIRKVSE